eukprot:TRINITY_DN12560_c0_g1_i1.p1 TRINITY_DN12560_c0_g1~~TRINITY_DN12560_c0_g1_i1.p1  ORF type:complete len:183 (+),score=36.40 TRINITY_DN12560_c0_g1_i1:2-550(+)
MEITLVMVGSEGVGKSALTIQMVQHHFVEEYDPTIEDSYRKRVVIDKVSCLLTIYDTIGKSNYISLIDQLILIGQGFLLIYAVNSQTSYDEINMYRESILRAKDKDKVPMVVVGNKCDLEKERQVSTIEATRLGELWEVPFFETSAKKRINVDEAFFELVREVRKDIAETTTIKGRNRCSVL